MTKGEITRNTIGAMTAEGITRTTTTTTTITVTATATATATDAMTEGGAIRNTIDATTEAETARNGAGAMMACNKGGGATILSNPEGDTVMLSLPTEEDRMAHFPEEEVGTMMIIGEITEWIAETTEERGLVEIEAPDRVVEITIVVEMTGAVGPEETIIAERGLRTETEETMTMGPIAAEVAGDGAEPGRNGYHWSVNFSSRMGNSSLHRSPSRVGETIILGWNLRKEKEEIAICWIVLCNPLLSLRAFSVLNNNKT
mmetsp:Transcript_7309/g.21200  ORF Transcript_7309/g.21200 Transcript_7309/m.21200 type:complete len:258 (-) Transcript_7309:397-1170(-)